MSIIQPELNPENPQKKGIDEADATDQTTANLIDGNLAIDRLYPDTKSFVIPHENPYTINGGSSIQYQFISKPGKFLIHGRSPIDALRNGLAKLENENGDIYNQKKQITVNLQKKSNNRTNKLHKFMVKIFRIDHPVYRYKIELWKF
jgi:hypothetical protein